MKDEPTAAWPDLPVELMERVAAPASPAAEIAAAFRAHPCPLWVEKTP
jgi:hypothetical protein